MPGTGSLLPETPSSNSFAPLIELIDIDKAYGVDSPDGKVQPKVRVLKNVSLTIRAGEFVAIVGASGSGKSTLMNILGCLDPPSSGQYRFSGEDVANFSSDQLAWLRRTAFGFVFQSYHLISTESAVENVQVPALYAGVPEQQRRERAQHLLARLGLAEYLNYRPNQLSGGQQQRVSIARALMNGGGIILADEPTGALDTASGAEVMALLEELADAGHTVILITHDRAVAECARRVIELSDGEIVRDCVSSAAITCSEPNLLPPPDLSQSKHDKGSTFFAGLQDATRAASGVMLANPFRTALTLLGIVIGVASVIVLLSVAEGTKREIKAKLGVFGSNLMTLRGRAHTPQAPVGIIYPDDLRQLASLAETEFVEPTVGEEQLLRFGNADHIAFTRGNSTAFSSIYRWPVVKGRFFSHTEYATAAAVAVIGTKVRENLFNNGVNPIGRVILIGQSPFRVLGILEQKDDAGNYDANNQVVIPYTTATTRLFGPREPRFVSIAASEDYSFEHTEQVINETMEKLHHGRIDFRLRNNAASQKTVRDIMGRLSIMLGAIAAISLLVGGIGVMNVMLMTVRERTREIGIRMATGARQSDIMRQFLTESVLLSVVGGLVGVVLAFGLLLLVVLVNDDIPVAIVPLVVVGGFSCAVFIGVVFGFTPARGAARLDPVVALASE